MTKQSGKAGAPGRRHQKRIVVICACLLLVGAVSGLLYWNSGRWNMATSVNFIMNTVVEQRFYGRRSQEAVAEITAELYDFENRMSTYIAGSEIDQINQAAGKKPVKISEDTMDLLKTTARYCEEFGDVVDITIAPLTLEWGITSENPHVPDEQTIQDLLTLVDHHDLILDEDNMTAMLAKEGQALDLGAIAKGYSCDIVRRVADKYGVHSGYASIGGNMVVIGKKPDGTDYRFGIRDPRGDASQYIGVVTLEGMTMATSGDYERFFEEDGVRYHHILDPRTGYPASGGLISVSVISENGSLADFLSTAFFILGKEEALNYMDRSDFGLVLVDEEKNVYVSDHMKEVFSPNEEKRGEYAFYDKNGEAL